MVLTHLFQSPIRHGYVPVAANDLYLGMQIWVDLPWYKHPFPTNRFTVTTGKQLKALQGLPASSLYYHPGRSQRQSTRTPPSEPLSPPSSLQQLVQESDGVNDGQSPETEASRRARLQQASKLYAQTLKTSRELLRQISDGQGSGMEAAATATNMIQNFAMQLTHEGASLGLADIVHLGGLDQPRPVHGLNTSLLALVVGHDLELGARELITLGLAALLHDVGEQRLPSTLRYKTGPRSRPEQALFERHPLFSQEILGQLPGVDRDILTYVVQHHELLDGNGYPQRLQGEQVHPLAQILSVVDAYEELMTPGDHRVGLQPSQALSELYVKRAGPLSLKVITTLVRVLGVYPPGSLVQLSDGSLALVATVNPVHRLRPVVVVHDGNAQAPTTRTIDLEEQPDLSILRIVDRNELAPSQAEHMTATEALHLLLVTNPPRQETQ